MREYHVRICEGLGVKFPGSTRHLEISKGTRGVGNGQHPASASGPVWTRPFGIGLAGYADWRIFGFMAVLWKSIQAVALIVLMTGSVYAQVAPLPDNNTPPTKEEKEKKAADDAYRSSLRRIPATENTADPWGDVRPSAPAAAKKK
jgi:hypothetical protein